ncbi:hypothetical protein HELRODRAFT_62839 [Helobdella robusta]|uniref:RRM domain-containing protein n=1 Tax=Helobdella robusta TaxID=6412 RepID=T1FX58_HELRO|nr:hypothetical protein HELRODRAFT_62839 [Helobdella robusta]ESO12361.1 hypothetical protein HELRODRAFT_62839 [Helobdella robusta]
MTNLIVNYLPQNMSQDEIRSLFGSIGEMESCKLIRDKYTGQSLGYGFVNYRNPADAQRAVGSLNGLRLQNKMIKVSIARPSCSLIKGANLYVGGIPKSMTVQDLENLFSPCGNIITSRILIDPKTEKSKGVGFVRFDMRLEAERAIKQLNGILLSGSSEPMTVKFANHPSSLQNITTTISCQSPTSKHQQQTSPFSPREKSGGYCLLVDNLSPETDEVGLWQLFGPFGAVQNVQLMRDNYSISKSAINTSHYRRYAYVTMTDYHDAVLAIAWLNGLKINGEELHVSFRRGGNGVNIKVSEGCA